MAVSQDNHPQQGLSSAQVAFPGPTHQNKDDSTTVSRCKHPQCPLARQFISPAALR